jgi:hypothetical protein
MDDHAPIGGAGAPPSQRLNYFRIDLEMESHLRRDRPKGKHNMEENEIPVEATEAAFALP